MAGDAEVLLVGDVKSQTAQGHKSQKPAQEQNKNIETNGGHPWAGQTIKHFGLGTWTTKHHFRGPLILETSPSPPKKSRPLMIDYCDV